MTLNLCYIYYHRDEKTIECPDYSKQDETKEALRFQVIDARKKYFETMGKSPDADKDLTPTLYIITPTYNRPQQKAELTRVSNDLRLVPNLHWIVIEDAPPKTDLVTNFLLNSGLNYTHLHIPTPSADKPDYRGQMQRNQALQWLRDKAKGRPAKGVVYFADDYNTFSPKLFDLMRDTKRVSVWPVGFAGGIMVEKPIVKTDPATGELKV